MSDKISDEIIATLAQYYIHRASQGTVKWNKAEDLNVIFAAARQEGWSVAASAGVFWFSNAEGVKIKLYEGNYLSGGERISEGKPFGFFQETDAALAMSGRAANFINADEHGGLKNALKEAIVKKVAEKEVR